MTTRYLEFDSTYRDRTLYPLPSDFIVEMSQSGQGNKLTAKDPVSDASPILYWNNSFTEYPTAAASIISNITVGGAVPNTQGNLTFQITTSGANYLRQVRNFYVGCALAINNTGVITARRIVEYLPINLNNAIVTLDIPMADAVVGSATFYISNPTPIDTTTANSTIKTFIPGSNQNISTNERTQNFGLGGDNFYIGYIIQNTDNGNYHTITAFDSVTRLATLDAATSVNWITGGFNFTIRKTAPVEFGFGSGYPVLYATGRSVQLLDIAPDNKPTGTYDGDFLRITASAGAPSPYNITTNPPFDAAFAGQQNCQTQERRIQRYVYATGLISAISGVNITLGSNASSVDGYYIDTILTDYSVNVAAPAWPHPSSRIIAYNGTTKVATLEGALAGAAPGDTWFIKTAILSSPFSPIPILGNLYEIELFTRDNSNPFNYTGSIVSSQETVCYEVELLNLILPNVLLASGRGGRPIFYPYLYVELQQLSSSTSANRGIIYSNNPNSFKMLFRAVVDDTPIPAISPFIKIDGDGMVHTIKFKPNESFRFAVVHANGDPFRTTLDDTFSPTEANALTQISACFAFKRV